MKKRNNNSQGFILITIMLLLSLILTLLAAYYLTTSMETSSTRYSKGMTSGFYAAEAGLNKRAEDIRKEFVGFNVPAGSMPSSSNPCEGSNQGSGSYECRRYNYNRRAVSTYISDATRLPDIIIPRGERYQNLTAMEYRYTGKSLAKNVENNLEAELSLQFRTRVVPLFQFAAFYNKDLEILPGPTMTLSGPVHTNGDLYLYSNSASLAITGQVTAVGNIYRGRKDGSVSPNCNNNPVTVMDPSNPRQLVPSCPSRTQVTSAMVTPFNGMVQYNVPLVSVPGPDVFDPIPGKLYWDKADLRVVLVLNNTNVPTGIEVRKADDTIDAAATTTLLGCSGTITQGVFTNKAVAYTTLRNWRERNNGFNFGGPAGAPYNIRILDIDMQSLLNCLKNSNWFNTGKRLDETSDGGIVFHFTAKGPSSSALPSPYGVRIQNAGELQSTISGAPRVLKMSIISDQAVYTKGNFNSTNKIPAAIMADSINVLSGSWVDANSTSSTAQVASNTTINSAFLAGTDVTGNNEGPGGQGGAYNGGLENYPRLHENWTGRLFLYRGSFVSLGKPLHVSGTWGNQLYNPPNRDWNFDTSFNNPSNLPPITPRFVYLRQELFMRNFREAN